MTTPGHLADADTALTAKTHVNRAMTELAARDRAQLVVIAYECGLVSPATEPGRAQAPA